jgi:membrane protein
MFGMLNHWLFETDLTYRPRWRATLHGWLRLLAASLREVRDGELDIRAASLVYTTLLSFVPLLAFGFAIMKGFGVHNQLEPLLFNFLAPFGDQGIEMALRIIEFVDNVKVGVLGSIGLALLVYTFVSVMQKIEKSINHVWRVIESRPILQRSGQYFTLLVVGPILMFSSVGLTASIMSSEQAGTLGRMQVMGPLIAAAGWIIPYLLIVAAFMFVYLFMVNTRVRLVSALVGALVGGALWKIAGWAFASFIVTSAQYTAVYSAFATLILFMLWLYWSWFVLLLGAAVAFYHQHPEAQVAPRGAFRLSARMKERLGLEVARLIGENFYAGLTPWQPHTLAERLGMPEQGVRWALDALHRVGLIVLAGEDSRSWVPARDFGGVAMKEVLDALRAADEDPRVGTHAIETGEVLEAALRRMERAVASTLKGVTLRDMAFAEPEPLPGVTPELGGEDEGPVVVRREA